MKISEAIREMELGIFAFTEEFPRESRLFVAHMAGIPFAELDMHLQDDFPANKKSLFLQITCRRMNGEPPQYIVGSQEFMSLDFKVNPAVLIPRGDTECVAEQAIAFLKDKGPCRVADIGTGSGAIAVSIAYYCPEAQVWAVDISEKALHVANENALKNHVAERVTFLQGDLCGPLEGQFDLIISNPPYVSTTEMKELPAAVRQEPELALWGGTDGLDFYRRLAPQAIGCLAPGGVLLVEIGYWQRQAVCDILQEAGFVSLTWGSDYGGRDRWVCAHKSKE